MKGIVNMHNLFTIILLFSFCMLNAQREAELDDIITESSEPPEDMFLDDIVKRELIKDQVILEYEELREADIPWEKRVWRVIDVREKMNLPFTYPEKPFFTILTEAAINGDVTVFSPEDDKFSQPLYGSEVEKKMVSIDTQRIIDPETFDVSMKVVRNEVNPADVQRFRVKEVWYFNKEESVFKSRILGIAPIIDRYDEDTGAFLFAEVLFWAYYPQCREVFAKNKVFNAANDSATLTWSDVFEQRHFASYIIKQSNVLDYRIKDFGYEGVDLLLEGEKIKADLFNFEHDLWTF